MFNLENDRQDYGRLLAPPEGYQLELGVGTTYSLDLEALTLTAISLGLGAETDSMLGRNPISLLNALRKVTDKLVIFYEAGHLQIPIKNKKSKFFQLLEGMTIPVALPSINKNGNNYPSFHPKTWLLSYREIGSNKRMYRFIVMSRNLTFDRSWDIVVSLDGEPTGILSDKEQDMTLPISDFMGFLSRLTTTEGSKRIVESLRKQVTKVKFDKGDFDEVYFMPMGIKPYGYQIDLDDWLKDQGAKFHEALIMSPFISKEIISRFNDESRKVTKSSRCQRTLITRASELNKLDKESTSDFDIYTVADEIIDGESAISEGFSTISNEEPDFSDKELEIRDKELEIRNQESEFNDYVEEIRQQDIHAKILMFSHNRWGTSIYLGSMNASHFGFYRNIEFDVCLRCRNSLLSPSKFIEEIGLMSPRFVKRELTEKITSENENKEVDLAFKRLCRSKANGFVTFGKDGMYNVSLYFDPKMICERMAIKPITSNYTSSPLKEVTVFSQVPLIDITEYYVVTMPDSDGMEHKCILQIPIKDIPKERDSKICSTVINSKESLYEYLSLVLSDDKTQALLEGRGVLGGNEKFQFKILHTTGIYEKLLEASLHHKERFLEIKDIMQMLPHDNEITAEFNKLYSTFRKALRLKDYE